MRLPWLSMIAICGFLAIGAHASRAATATRSVFGRMPDGSPVEAVTLRNDRGVTVRVITYGARIQEVVMPDCNEIIYTFSTVGDRGRGGVAQ